MRSTVTLDIQNGVDPFAHNASRSKRSLLREFLALLKAVVMGGVLGRAANRPSVIAGTARASGTVTLSGVDASDTLTVNGQALTATQHHARGTVTCSAVDVADTVTLQGVVFTAAAAENLATRAFDQSGTDAACAASLAACINAEAAVVGSALAGLVTATVLSGAVVTIRAVAAGTGGNSITLASSDGTDLAVSGATLAGGAAVANNEFDFGGSNAETATALKGAINNSTTDIVEHHVKAANRAGTITLASVTAGEWVSVGGVRFTAVTATPTNVLTEFSIGSTDTNDATALKNAINAHPSLKDRVLASSSSGVVTVRELPPEGDAAPRLEKSGANITLSGAALAAVAVVLVAATQKGHSGNAITIAGNDADVTCSAARLSGGTSTTYTF